MKVVPLGISSGVPTRTRNVSAVAVVLSRGWILLDCGEGTQQRIQMAGLRKSRLDAIFITHLHGDHVFGLPGLLGTMSMQGRVEPLFVHGPPGLRDFVETALRISQGYLSYPLTLIEEKKMLLAQAIEDRCILFLEHDPRLAAGTVKVDTGQVVGVQVVPL
jgi:ribonuclease Z